MEEELIILLSIGGACFLLMIVLAYYLMYGFDCTNHTARYNEKINAENNYRYRVDLNELVQTEDEKQLLKDVEKGLVREDFLCPLGFKIMTDPVVANDGYTYQRSNISKYLQDNKSSNLSVASPITGEPLQSEELFANKGIQLAIIKWEKNGRLRIKKKPLTRKRSFTTNIATNYKDSLETKSALIDSKRKNSKAKLQKRLTQRRMSNGNNNNNNNEKQLNGNDGKIDHGDDVKNWKVSDTKSPQEIEKEKVISKMANHSNAYIDFICPVSLKVMRKPYFCKSDGFTYDKKTILKYIKQSNATNILSPMDNAVNIVQHDFIENHALEEAILYWKSQANNYIPKNIQKEKPGADKKKKKKKKNNRKRNRSFTKNMIKDWEKNHEHNVEKTVEKRRKVSQNRLKTRLFKRDMKVTPIDKADEFFEEEVGKNR
jgi:hypothetical protein